VPAVRAIRARHYSLRGALENANDSGGVVGKSEVIQIGLPISRLVGTDPHNFRAAISSGNDLNLYPKAIEATAYGISGCPTTYHTLSGKIFSELGNIPRLAEFHILLEQNLKQRGIGA
jgi:hypothetical protein